jgi:hypothetical protein
LFLNEDFPVYAVFLYAKNDRADFTSGQKRSLARLVSEIKAEAQQRKKR